MRVAGDFHLNDLFNACFRIQREASDAAGRYIPLIVENVKGAQPWVGPAKAHFGSFYLWGDVESVGNRITVGKFGEMLRPAGKRQKYNPDGTAHGQGSWFKIADSKNRGAQSKNEGGSWFNVAHNTESGHGQNPVNGVTKIHTAGSGETYGGDFGWDGSAMRTGNSKSPARKAASALIAEIPYDLTYWIANVFKPVRVAMPIRASVNEAVTRAKACQ